MNSSRFSRLAGCGWGTPQHVLRRWVLWSGTLLLVCVLAGCGPDADAQLQVAQPTPLPAFPGAEGFGAQTPGGRGGRVILVTTLADSGPGSLRAALEATGPRIIVFRVGGTIDLESRVALGEAQSYVTVAGQTAPGDGIQIRGFDIFLGPGVHDVIIRNMRFRPGVTNPEDWSKHALMIYGTPAQPTYNIIIDHASLYWGPDENGGVWGTVRDVTWQWSLFAEGIEYIYAGVRYEGSKGLLIGSDTANGPENITVHHSYFANNAQRNPLLKDRGPIHIINNVVYNWSDFGTQIKAEVPQGVRVNLIGNAYVRGPDSRQPRYPIGIDSNPDNLVYVRDNRGPFMESADPWAMVGWGGGAFEDYWRVPAPRAKQRTRPWPAAPIPVTIDRSSDVRGIVLPRAGAILPERDAVDQRQVDNLTDRTGRIITGVQLQQADWPRLASGTPPPDSDNDGMPDVWERAQGLDPNNPDDGAQPSPDGYTWVERYINSLFDPTAAPAPPPLPGSPTPSPTPTRTPTSGPPLVPSTPTPSPLSSFIRFVPIFRSGTIADVDLRWHE